MIIDSHTHLDDLMHQKKHPAARLRALLAAMKQSKVDRAMILADIPLEKKEKMLSHEDILALIEPHKQLSLVGKVPLPVAQNAAYLKGVHALVAAEKMKGIKLYPGYEPFYPHDKRYNKVYDLCEQFDIPVMIHTGDVMEGGVLEFATPLHVDRLAAARPELKIIMCHMGNPWQLDAAAVTFKNENVYADTAGLFYQKLDKHTKYFLHRKIEEFVHWNEKGEKLVFGSDWPITSVKDTISLINSLHFSKKEKHQIFCGNAKKLFKIR